MPAPGDQYNSPNIPNPFETSVQRVSTYTAQEIATFQSRLNKRLGPEYISFKPGPGGKKVAYLAAEKVIQLANEVFGFNGWSSSLHTMAIDYVEENKESGKVNLGLSVICRITLKDGTYHEDYGYGSVENFKGKGGAFQKAKKEAATDGMKRALRMFGNVMGNCLYDKDFLAKVQKIKPTAIQFEEDDLHRHADTGIPIKREPQQQPAPRIANGPQSLRTNTEALGVESIEFEDEFASNLFDGVEISENDIDDDLTLDAVSVPEIPDDSSSNTMTEAPPLKPPVQSTGVPPNRNNQVNHAPPRQQARVQPMQGVKQSNPPVPPPQQSHQGDVRSNGPGPQGPQPQPYQGNVRPTPPGQQGQQPQQFQGNGRSNHSGQHGQQGQQPYQGNGRPSMQPANQARGPQTPNPQQNCQRPEVNRGRMAPPTTDIHAQPRPQPYQQQQNRNQNQPIQQQQRSTPPQGANAQQQNQGPHVNNQPQRNGAGPNPAPVGKPPVGFVTGRAAERLQQVEGTDNGGLPPDVIPFNPHADSPVPKGLRTPGIDHTKSARVTREEVQGSKGGQQQQRPPNGAPYTRPNFVNPAQDSHRRIGMPGAAMSPLANRTAYKPPAMANGVKRPPLADVSNKGGDNGAGEGPDAKRIRMDGPENNNPVKN